MSHKRIGGVFGDAAAARFAPPLPVKDGVAPSYLWLPQGTWPDLLTFLVQHFTAVSEQVWLSRFARAEVVERSGARLYPDSPTTQGMCIFYYREIEDELAVPFEERILYRDERIVVVDKPHFLAVIPGGRHLHETLLVRLKKKLGLDDLVPIHRLDRETAGIVIFSCDPATRGAYQSLFQQRQVGKVYEALAAPLAPALAAALPLTYRSRIVKGAQFFYMQETPGEPNAETRVEVIGARGAQTLYRLHPLSGRQHQLRVHMAALGSPILNDPFYPQVLPDRGDDFSRPLQLLARAIAFADPVSGAPRQFESTRALTGAAD